MPTESQRLVTVCDNCFRASCWEGIFMCDESRTAGLIELPVSKLRKLNVEHPDYYSKEHIEKYTNPPARR